MKQAALFGIALAFIGTAATAQSPFDGAWRFETVPTKFVPRTFNITLADGVYSCQTCHPQWSVPADGAFHAVSGHESFDETSVEVVDNRTVIFTRRLAGRGVYQAIDRISEDAKFLAFAVTEFSGAGKPIATTGCWVRETPLPLGSHPITGTWREFRPDVTSDNASTFTIRTDGEDFTMNFGTGESLAARFDGPPVKIEGDPSGTLVSMRRIGERSVEETDRLGGEIVEVRTSTLVDDSTLEIVSRKPNGRETRRVARKYSLESSPVPQPLLHNR